MVYALCHAPNRMPVGLDYVLRDESTESQEANEAEVVVDDHVKTQQNGTLRRLWSMFAPTKEWDSSAARKQPEISLNNAGLDPDGRSIYPTHSNEELPDDHEAAGDGAGNGNKVSKRKGIRNFFSRSVRIKNGNTDVVV
jgi:hypothetical protein